MENGSEIMGVGKPKERAHSRAFMELCLMFAGSMGVRDGAGALNRVLWRTEATEIKLRTCSDFCQRQGRHIEEAIARESAKALEENGFDADGGTPLRQEGGAWNDVRRLEETKETLEGSFGLGRERLETLASEPENPAESCCVSPDGVTARCQKERRTEKCQKEKAFVKNAVIEVQTPGNSVILTAVGMKTAFMALLAYLLSNGLLSGKAIVFFTEGAKGLRGYIMKLFAFRKFRVILGRHHLMEGCKACLSMSFKGGKEQRNQILLELSPPLMA